MTVESDVEYTSSVITETKIPARGDLAPIPLLIRHETPTAGKRPLVIISHGSGSSHQAFRTLAEHLATNGFVVAMPEHPFNNRNDNSRADTFESLVDRPRHVSAVLDWFASTSPWSQSVSMDSVTIIGHSIGAYTALAVAGGLPHTQHQIKYDPTTKITRSELIPVKRDPRVKALVLLAPAAGWFMSDGALDAVTASILMLTAEKDTGTPALHGEIILKGIKDTAQITHRVVPNAGHYSFMAPFPAHMKTAAFPPANDPPGFDREAFLPELAAEVLAFLA